MALATRPSRKRHNRGLVFEHVEHRRMMAGDVAAMQPTVAISDDAQYMVELVNQARSNPLAEARRQGIDLNQGLAAGSISNLPKQPLAPNQSLVDAALAHSEDMLDNQYFDHTGQNGSSPSTRAQDAGYSTGAAENIALNSMSGRNLAGVVAASHDMLFQSAGHRQNLLNGYMSDIGIGNAAGDWTYNNGASYSSVLSTQMFGREGNTLAALTGVAYTDAVIEDDFYTPGEGMDDVMIEAVSTSGARYITQTGTSGGYTLRLPAGQYSVRATDTVSKTVAALESVQIGTINVKLDWLQEQFTPAGDDELQPDGSPPLTTVPADSQNLDVNGDNVISPNDVLIVINHLANSEMNYRPELDVNRDDSVSPLDALIIINHLNETALTSTDSIENEDVVTTEVAIDDSRLAELSNQAIEKVLQQLPADRDLVIESAMSVTWSDSSLELFNSPENKTPTPGYQIVVRYGTMLIEYRASATGSLQQAGWVRVADYLDDENQICCPWNIDAPCLEAFDKALESLIGDFIPSAMN